MPYPRVIVGTTLVLASLASTSGRAQDGDEGGRPRRVADQLLAALVEANGVPGMGAAVVVDGRVAWHGSAGLRDIEAGVPVDRHTEFRLASVSKLVAATAAAKLAEAGRLDPDAPVQASLPWLQAEWAPLTPRQLAAHTSGMPHYQEADRNRGATRYPSVRAAVDLFDDRELLAAPGEAYVYSSWGYTLLSAAIEAAAGKPLLDYVASEVTPGLAIGPDASDSGGPRASRNYGFSDGRIERLPAHDFSYTWAGGGLSATPEAIALFGDRVMDGEVVSKRTFQSMLVPARLADGSAVGERDFQVGFGWRTSRDTDGETIAHHAGATVGARSALVLWPTRRVAASVLSNAEWIASIERTAEMLAAPFQPRRAPEAGPAPACPVDAIAYVADYAEGRFGGDATFSAQDGICRGRIQLPEGPLRAWLNGFPQRDAESLEIIGVHAGAGLRRAALVTPIGLLDLRADPDGRTLRGELGSSRPLVIRLAEGAANR